MPRSAGTPGSVGQRSQPAGQPVSDRGSPHAPITSWWPITRGWADFRWADFRWGVLGIAGVVAFVFGCIGYTEYYHHLEQIHLGDSGPRPTDVFYHSLMLFLPATAPERSGLPIWLDIARFLAPIVAGYAALAGLASLFRDRVQQIRAPFMRDHVVVCGLGYVGGMFLRHLQESKVKVVAVEINPADPLIEVCRSLRIPVIVGDAQLERTLHAAGVQRAAHLLAVCTKDAVNTQIIAVARRMATGRHRGELHCLARIGDPDLCALLRIQELNLPPDPSSALDFFNTDEIGARLLLQKFDPFDAQVRRPHLLVSRLDGLGNWLVRHAARTWYDARTEDVLLWISVIDDHAKERVQALVDQHPELEPMCRFLCTAASDREMHQLPKVHADAAAPPLTRAYVTASRDEDALETALALRNALDPSVPLVVALSRAHGVGQLINDASANGKIENINIEMFPSLEITCTTEFVRGGSFEPIAVALHNQWREEQLAQGKDAPAWNKANESLRDSSRAQAREVAVKVHSIGCAIVPLRDWGAKDFEFESEEVERLARDEHDRWIPERTKAGWRSGPRDHEEKTTPYLIPFDKLPPDIAEYDRVFVRAIPRILASAGFQVERRSQH